jgi:hypothetical protein
MSSSLISAIFGEKMAFFSKTNFLYNLAVFCVKNAIKKLKHRLQMAFLGGWVGRNFGHWRILSLGANLS